MKVSRKINWISSVKHPEKIDEIEKGLSEFYRKNPDYYSDIQFTADNWIHADEAGYVQILDWVHESESICEIGCGSANIFKHYPGIAQKYTGLDFSEKLLNENAAKYPNARFKAIETANYFPEPESKFDLVFSVFVLEHVTRPAVFLKECERILKPGGTLIILCPDFLGKGRMSSQRAGFSEGTASAKLKLRKYLDALVTLFDNRVRIPFVCRHHLKKINVSPLFLINLSPTMFTDTFQPDVDAVYVTSKIEVLKFLETGFSEIKNNEQLEQYTRKKKLIFLQLKKN